ncbi:hydrogenase maturation protease [Candidatus Symbiobacter mobilis]|uniref:Hydrogenase maturation protease n=1 Tax=Candidatus Symbiobacter mobilis CR TaxID=946483 RepID=U5N9Z4_9BURK|nr:hydrogenase maturation protease [Candidatus Symbiobacter mobilis]AGX87073.1 hydrogenase maturation protease [Candidatus Symbiobacter mobilis CR]
MRIAPLLVLAWGNPARGDDALGPSFLEALHNVLPQREQVELLEDFQLMPEHALDLLGRERVLFVDASATAAAPFTTRPLHAAQDASHTTHALSPEAVLQVYLTLQGHPAPPSTLLAIRGEQFELGQSLSPSAQAHLQAAVQWAVEQWAVEQCAIEQ